MSNEIVSSKTKLSEVLADSDKNIYHSLKNSVYPGAKDESIGMVLEYCKAKGYDPLAKTVHIVPMSVKDSKTGKYDYRDVIMPGIAAYRVDASRTGQYVGLSEPTYGPMITEKLSGTEVTYPEWCKITIKKKMDDGLIAEFTALEFWKENYGTKGKDSSAPNAMWEKRARGQLAKCAEAQALRKAFPDAVGNQHTFEEMEGKIDSPKPEFFQIEQVDRLVTDEEICLLLDKIELAGHRPADICKSLEILAIEDMRAKHLSEVHRKLDRKIAANKKVALDVNKIYEEPKAAEELTNEEWIAELEG